MVPAVTKRAGRYVELNGVGFDTDPHRVSWQTVPVTREAVDQSAAPGESSLSNGVVWRRNRDDLIDGAGQTFADLANNQSSDQRFNESVGVDVYTTRRSVGLLVPLTQVYASTEAVKAVLATDAAGVQYLYFINGVDVIRRTNLGVTPGTYTTCTGAPGGGHKFTDITTDGSRVWFANPTAGGSPGVIYYLDAGATALTVFAGLVPDKIISYAHGRLFGDGNNVVRTYDAVGSGTIVFTHPSTNFVWDGVASAPGGIYLFGHLGVQSQLYVVTADPTTGGLDAAVFAGSLPAGELYTAMTFYQGIVIVGTTAGLRLGTIGTNGWIDTGAAVEAGGPARCIAPEGEDVLFGWDGVSTGPGAFPTGLGRARLSRLLANQTLVPSYAHDSQADAGVYGAATSIVSVPDPVVGYRRFLTIAGKGLYQQTQTPVASGCINLGAFTFGVPERKLLDSLTLWTDPLPVGASILVQVFADDGPTPKAGDIYVAPTGTPVLTASYTGTGRRTQTFITGTQLPSEFYSVLLTLTNGSGSAPGWRRLTLRAVPVPFVPQQVTMPLLLSDKVTGEGVGEYDLDVYAEWIALEALLKSRTRFPARIGKWTSDVRLDALEVAPVFGGDLGLNGWTKTKSFLQGRWLVTLTTLQPVE